jgi:glycosyltransferase involved in cell wall biosynthesis
MKIDISSKRYRPLLGGTVQYTAMLAGAFREAGHEVRIMTRTQGDLEEPDLLRFPDCSIKWQLAGWADVLLQVDASWSDGWPFMLRGVPWFPTLHFGYPMGPVPLRKRLALAGLQAAFLMGRPISVGHEVARSWGIKGPVIPNPYDDSVFFPPPAGFKRDVDILFVGRLEESKGIFVLVEALNFVASKLDRGLDCVFVGEGIDGDRLSTAIARSAPMLRLTMAGRQDADGVATMMRRSRVLAFPTTRDWIEASPLTPLEAVACGCQIVASDNGGTRENIGPDGFLVPMGDAMALAESLARALALDEAQCSNAVADFLLPRKLDQVARHYLEIFAAV